MGSQDGPAHTEVGGVERDIRDTRTMVEWYFGDLIDSVARDNPVSDEQLLAALTWIDLEARTRREELEQRGDSVPTKGAPGDVVAVPAGTWRVMARAHDLSEAEEKAARSVHQRMARSIAKPPEAEQTVPLVYAAEPGDLD